MSEKQSAGAILDTSLTSQAYISGARAETTRFTSMSQLVQPNLKVGAVRLAQQHGAFAPPPAQGDDVFAELQRVRRARPVRRVGCGGYAMGKQ
jgi:hypothetical protein